MTSRAELLAASHGELRALLAGGHPIEASRLDDTTYRGISLGLPAWVERLSWKKFTKAFHRDPRDGRLRGWNVRIEQDGLERPWRARVRDGTAVDVRPLRGGGASAIALMLDYGAGGNGRLDPLGLLRDPLVALHAGSVELLLGWSYLARRPREDPDAVVLPARARGPARHPGRAAALSGSERGFDRQREDVVRAVTAEVRRRRGRRVRDRRDQIQVAEVARAEPVAAERVAQAGVQPDVAERRLIERDRARRRGRAIEVRTRPSARGPARAARSWTRTPPETCHESL